MADGSDQLNESTTPSSQLTSQDRSPLAVTLLDSVRLLASLKITVALFAMAIFLILAGTLAQAKLNMWEVMSQYFHSWIVMIQFDVFFPESFFPNKTTEVGGAFPFPGGALIGMCMAINLVAAHSFRFKSQAKGSRLTAGMITLAVGAAITALVIVNGHSSRQVQGELSSGAQNALWLAIKLGLAALWCTLIYVSCNLRREQKLEWAGTISGLVILGGLLAYLFYNKMAMLDGSSLRILWQLTQGTIAGVVCLVGCILIFGKRGGIVLLHAGVGLMMFGEMLVGNYAIEENMSIFEGETATHAEDIRTTEIAIWDDSDEDESVGTLIPREQFVEKRAVSTDFLPFDVRVDAYFKNHKLSDREADQDTLANAGFGKDLFISQARAGAGADSDSAVDVAACYLTLLRKGSDEELGTYMLTQRLNRPEEFEFEKKKYRMFLRFRHNPKPYAITLIDVARKNYVGTNTPQDYHSDIRLIDKNHPGEGIKKRIWMNNPLRYAGETFYQSKYDNRGGREITVLQIVKNRGWMIPYVSCMLVIIGMLAHFSICLSRFLRRRSATDEQLAIATAVTVGAAAIGVIPTTKRSKKLVRGRKNVETQKGKEVRLFVPIAILIVAATYIAAGTYKASKGSGEDEFDIKGFGSLPVAYQGRVKPFDTLARNTLRAISNKDEFVAEVVGENGKKLKVRRPAIRFLLDVACQRPEAQDYKVFRIPSLQVQDKLELKRRKGFRYSYKEIVAGVRLLKDEFETIRKKKADKLTQTERKLVQLFRRLERFNKVRDLFLPPPLSPLGDPNSRAAAERFQQEWRDTLRFIAQIEQADLPRPVPGELDSETNRLTQGDAVFKKTWQIYGTSLAKAFGDQLFQKDVNPALRRLETMRIAYASYDPENPGDSVTDFNKAVEEYHRLLRLSPPTDSQGVPYESFYNSFNPFYIALVLYVAAFVLAALSWLFAPALWNRSAFCLLLLTFALHTYALLGRIYISGRPPVTNLYSSSVFIGWGCVLLALILEFVYRLGIGNFVASVAGFGTLLVSIYLGADGDTFAVLQAVLDTQFWLSTHVVTVTFGYSTTFVAGLLGIQYIAMGIFSETPDAEKSKSIARMIYGVICFAMFFSFVGTVLGGLWADDSWGRFWGWDPKENGALIIVLWNALILHARWGGMVRDRGLAVLAVAGNIITSWSWFGVNELGVGLHSYGFTDGVLLALGIFAASQLCIVAVGCMPQKYWSSLAYPILWILRSVLRLGRFGG